MSKPVTVVAIVKAKPGKTAELKEGLLKLLEPSRDEEGCIEYVMHEDIVDSSTFVFVEKWESSEALQKHLTSVHLDVFSNNSKDIVEKINVFQLTKSEV